MPRFGVDDRGAATILDTGVKTVSPAQATLRDGRHSFLEVQCLATSTDSDWRTWQKLPKEGHGRIALLVQPKPVSLKISDGTQEILAVAFDPTRSGRELAIGGMNVGFPLAGTTPHCLHVVWTVPSWSVFWTVS